MSVYSMLPDIVRYLRELPVLEGVTVTEDFVSPTTHRPILSPVVSVGIKRMVMNPISRDGHCVDSSVSLTALFPCGVGENPRVSETVYRMASSLIGQTFLLMTVKEVLIGKTSFDAAMYGVRVEMELVMEGNFNRPNTEGAVPEEHFTVGTLVFDRMPEQVRVSKAAAKDTALSAVPREFFFKGRSVGVPDGALWEGLQTLFAHGTAVHICIPRSDTTVSALPVKFETETDLCGYGFSYEMTFQEVL